VPGPDGRDQLTVSHAESPHLAVLAETTAGSGRFEMTAPFTASIRVDLICTAQFTYAWWWAPESGDLVEQSTASVTRTP
jgi:hypothetical protein